MSATSTSPQLTSAPYAVEKFIEVTVTPKRSALNSIVEVIFVLFVIGNFITNMLYTSFINYEYLKVYFTLDEQYAI